MLVFSTAKHDFLPEAGGGDGRSPRASAILVFTLQEVIVLPLQCSVDATVSCYLLTALAGASWLAC